MVESELGVPSQNTFVARAVYNAYDNIKSVIKYGNTDSTIWALSFYDSE